MNDIEEMCGEQAHPPWNLSQAILMPNGVCQSPQSYYQLCFAHDAIRKIMDGNEK